MATNNNINYTPAAVNTGAPAPAPIGPLDTAPAAVDPGPGLGYVPTTTRTPVIPQVELPVQTQLTPEGMTGTNVGATTQQRYITILANGVVVTNNAATLDFEGNGFTIANLGTNGATITLSGAAGYGNSNVVTLLAAFGSNTLSTTGNVTGGYILGNGSQLTGLAATYGNANVATFLASFGSNTISTTGNITSGNISTGIITLTNGAVIKDTAGNAIAIGRGAGDYPAQGINAVAVGNTAGNYLQGNSAVAVGDRSGGYTQGNSAVAVGQFAGNYLQGANAVAVGNSAGYTGQGTAAIAIGTNAGVTNQGNNSIIINATAANLNQTTANTFTVAPVRNDVANIGNVMFYNTTSKEITYGNVISVAGNITGGNILTGGLISATGTVTGSSLLGAVLSVTANVTGGNVLTAGLISAAGNVTGGNVLTGGLISATGNVTGGNILGGANVNATTHTGTTVSVSGNVTGGNVLTAGLISATSTITSTANITGGNILTGGLISVTGNIVTGASGFIGVGTATPDAEINILATPQTVSYSLSGNSTTLGTDLHISGADGANTRITQDAFGTGSYVAFTGRASRGTAAAPTQTVSGDTLTQFTARGFSNGTLQFGNASTGRVDIVAAENFTDTARGTNVQIYTTAAGAITPTAVATFSSANGFSAVGNVSGGNLLTGGLASVTGNITGGNVLTAGLISATSTITSAANITGGNLLTGGLISATSTITSAANITGGNLLTGGLVSATSNITGGNILTAGIMSSTGNATHGNLSVTGNITGNTNGFTVGYLNIPQVSLASNVSIALTDAGKHYYTTSASNLTLTIANNTSVAWAVGTAISVINRGTANVAIAQDTGVSLYLAGNATSGNRIVTTYGMATLINTAANVWMISGTVV